VWINKRTRLCALFVVAFARVAIVGRFCVADFYREKRKAKELVCLLVGQPFPLPYPIY